MHVSYFVVKLCMFNILLSNYACFLFVFVCLFDFIQYVPSTIFQVNMDGSSWVEPVQSWHKCVLFKNHNAVTPVKPVPALPRSRVKHSTTEPLRSLSYFVVKSCMYHILLSNYACFIFCTPFCNCNCKLEL